MKKLTSALLVAAMVLSFAACGTGTAPGKEPAQPSADVENTETYIFADDADREVEVPREITRLVPSSLLAQIVLYSIAPDLFVGISSEWNDSARGIIDDSHFSLPCFGNLYSSADLNIEELALTAPQIIIDIGEPKTSIREDLDTLQEQTRIPSVYISTSLETLPETYRRLGALLGREEKGEELAQRCEEIYSRTLSIMEKVGDEKVDALYILGEEGLSVLANSSYHAELMDMLTNNLAVVDNPLSKGTGNEVTMEQIALWDPEFIVFGPGSIYGTAAERETWANLEAIASGSYVEVPDSPHNWMNMPPSAQRYLGLIWLPAVLYPAYCDYDVQAEIMEYYALFYDCDLTEEQYETITANAFLKG